MVGLAAQLLARIKAYNGSIEDLALLYGIKESDIRSIISGNVSVVRKISNNLSKFLELSNKEVLRLAGIKSPKPGPRVSRLARQSPAIGAKTKGTARHDGNRALDQTTGSLFSEEAISDLAQLEQEDRLRTSRERNEGLLKEFDEWMIKSLYSDISPKSAAHKPIRGRKGKPKKSR